VRALALDGIGAGKTRIIAILDELQRAGLITRELLSALPQDEIAGH
jgi:hypothetical protein